MLLSTLFISSNDTVASDSGEYTCQEMITVNGTDMFTYSDSSRVALIGKCTWLSQCMIIGYVVYYISE